MMMANRAGVNLLIRKQIFEGSMSPSKPLTTEDFPVQNIHKLIYGSGGVE